MRYASLFPMLLIAALLACSREPAIVQDKATGLYLPGDLEATLWAESPLFYNPTNMDVDAKGRIWVTEAVNYRNYNNDSTRILHHEEGDRVVILEDRDQDGRADTSIVFVQDKDLRSPLGIAVIGNQVVVSCAPNLIVYTDEDGDDKPDSKKILLTGFGGFDHDHSLHSVVVGPEGQWYFNVGNAGPHLVQDRSGWTLRSGSVYTGGSPYNSVNEGNMRSDDGKIWVGGLQLRVNSDGSGLKVLGHGFRNSYETCVDSYGDMWQNDNDDQVVTCRASWLMEGANAGYFSADGSRYWMADQRPGQDMFTAHWHQEDPGVMPAGDNTGAGSPTGVAVNEGDGLGKRYRGLFFSADAGRNVIFSYLPRPKGAGFDLGPRTNLIRSSAEDDEGYVWNDSLHDQRPASWFRPSDVMIGTDGALYIADWYDPVVGGHLLRDSTGYGRIYRIAPKGKKLSAPKIDLSTLAGQIEALKSPAPNVRGSALALVRQSEESMRAAVKALQQSANPYHQARAVFLMAELAAKADSEARKALFNLLENPKDERLATAAFRAIRPKLSKDAFLELATTVSQSPQAMLRRELALALRDMDYESKRPLLLALIDQYSGENPWELEAIGLAVGEDAEKIWPDIEKRLEQGKSAHSAKILRKLAWRLHPPATVSRFAAWAADSSLSPAERREVLTGLGFTPGKKAAEAMLALSKSPLPDVAETARYWLAFRESNDWAGLLPWEKTGLDLAREKKIAGLKAQIEKLRNKNIADWDRERTALSLAKDSIGGQMLLGLLAGVGLEEKLRKMVEEPLLQNPDLSVRTQAASYFKPAGGSNWSVDKLLALKPDLANGEVLFERSCAICHRLGQNGATVGPDLSQIAEKYDRRALLDAIVNPSAGIVFGYEGWLIDTRDGDAVFGFIVADGKTLVMRDLAGNQRAIPAARVASRQKQESSLMPGPEGLGLSETDVADIVGYLQQWQ